LGALSWAAAMAAKANTANSVKLAVKRFIIVFPYLSCLVMSPELAHGLCATIRRGRYNRCTSSHWSLGATS
jgi:hypothetical protein